MEDAMNTAAISHRCAYTDCYAYSEDVLEINIKTGLDVDSVTLVWSDPYSFRKKESGHWSGGNVIMQKQFILKDHIIWNCKIEPFFKRAEYYFEIAAKDEKILFFENDYGTEEEVKICKDDFHLYKMAWMNKNDIVKIPEWVKDTIWYQIFPDRFCSKGEHFKRFKNKNWGDENPMLYSDFFGGDLCGIIEKLEYLKDLGISGIYLNPILKSNSNHKYNTEDYSIIDPDFGTEEDMKKLVQKAHELGIRVMIDAVFNHSGFEFAYWKDVLKNGEKSVYKDWFFVNKFPVEDLSLDTSDGRYFSFDFVRQMPKLNTNNPVVQEYFKKICVHWVADWKIDGIRFDVGNEVSHDFIKLLHRSLLSVNPELFLLGEIWTDSVQWLGADEYHSVMNYPFMNAVQRFFGNAVIDKKNDLKKENFASMFSNVYSLYYRQTNSALFNFLDTHDTGRAIDSCKNLSEFYQRIAILMTMQGSPCIYYGTEIALSGSDGPYNRRCMPWEKIEAGEFSEVTDVVKEILKIRNEYSAARSENIEFIQEKNQRLIHYIKFDKDSNQKLEVYINASDSKELLRVENYVVFGHNYKDEMLLPGGILMSMEKNLDVNGKSYHIKKLLGKGKGGYSYLAESDGKQFVLKQIHHEPCSYYTFGNKIEAEKKDYERLAATGIKLPVLYDIDEKNERILKEYVDGSTIVELVKQDKMKPVYIEQVQEMCRKLYAAGLNIDYYPTNFLVQDEILYYVDYECNNYMDEWNFENWGVKFWSKTEEFIKAFGE